MYFVVMCICSDFPVWGSLSVLPIRPLVIFVSCVFVLLFSWCLFFYSFRFALLGSSNLSCCSVIKSLKFALNFSSSMKGLDLFLFVYDSSNVPSFPVESRSLIRIPATSDTRAPVSHKKSKRRPFRFR